MKIHHLGIRGKCFNFIENLYLSSKKFVKVVPSHQFCLTCSLMIFLIIVINMASQLVISVVVEVFLQMTLCYVLQQDPNLRKLLKFASKWARNNEIQFGINKCASLVVRGEVSRFLYNSNPTFYLSSQELPKTNYYTYVGVIKKVKC